MTLSEDLTQGKCQEILGRTGMVLVKQPNGRKPYNSQKASEISMRPLIARRSKSIPCFGS